jgi:hypothetical protein
LSPPTSWSCAECWACWCISLLLCMSPQVEQYGENIFAIFWRGTYQNDLSIT